MLSRVWSWHHPQKTVPSPLRYHPSMSAAAALTVAEFPGPVLEVPCPLCDRRGRYAKARLVERFGPNLSLPDLLGQLSPDCPTRGRPGESCSAIYPALAEAF